MREIIVKNYLHLLCILYTLIYTGSLYAQQVSRPSKYVSKNHPTIIKSRIVVAAITSICCLACTTYLLKHEECSFAVSFLHIGRIWPAKFAAVGRALLLTCVLFAGPIFDGIFERRAAHLQQRRWERVDWLAIRDYVAVGTTFPDRH